MKIVILSQVIYPNVSPRAHRASQLAIELARVGHDVTLYALLGNYDYSDFVRRTNVKVKSLGRGIAGLIDSDGYLYRNILYRILTYFFHKWIYYPEILMYPMIQRIYLDEKNIDLLITIAVPFINHFATSYMHHPVSKCWISDCGDPFMGNPFDKRPFYFKFIERHWLRRTDYITIPVASAINAYDSKFRNKVRIIPQGFDFSNYKLANYVPNSVPTFAYSGAVYRKLRDPSKFLDFLSTLKFDFKFIIYTNCKNFFEDYRRILGDKLELRDYIPRNTLLYELSKMDFLINIENKSSVQQPSKLIDYALTGRPCLNISSDFSNGDDFMSFIDGDYTHQYLIENLEDYDIRNVANKFLLLYREKMKKL